MHDDVAVVFDEAELANLFVKDVDTRARGADDPARARGKRHTPCHPEYPTGHPARTAQQRLVPLSYFGDAQTFTLTTRMVVQGKPIDVPWSYTSISQAYRWQRRARLGCDGRLGLSDRTTRLTKEIMVAASRWARRTTGAPTPNASRLREPSSPSWAFWTRPVCSFVAQRDRRIGAGRGPGGHHTRRERHAEHEQRGAAEPDRIGRAHAEQDTRQNARDAMAATTPITAPTTTGRMVWRRIRPSTLRRCRPQRQANANLPIAPGDRVRHDAVDADRGQHAAPARPVLRRGSSPCRERPRHHPRLPSSGSTGTTSDGSSAPHDWRMLEAVAPKSAFGS